MNTFLRFRSVFLQDTCQRSALFRYGFLGIVLMLFVFHAGHAGPHYLRGFIVPTMLLLNHLAYQFRWPVPMTFALRLAAWIWIAVGVALLIWGS